ncbi:hypothetical protein EV401DRAFT_1901421 [Pisolithus croceorrhizus]|nr:hypothetical protein EV401DRAFT_1901421 [Pisolithus croceorrhizus]
MALNISDDRAQIPSGCAGATSGLLVSCMSWLFHIFCAWGGRSFLLSVISSWEAYLIYSVSGLAWSCHSCSIRVNVGGRDRCFR